MPVALKVNKVNGRELKELGSQAAKLQQKYSQQLTHFCNDVIPYNFNNLKHYRIMDYITKHLIAIIKEYKNYRNDIVKSAVHELVRKTCCDELKCKFDHLLRYYATWEHVGYELYDQLLNVVQERSDDGYSDFLDAIPLVGPVVLKKILITKFSCDEKGWRQLQTMIHKEFDQDPDGRYFSNMVIDGENYFGMSFTDAFEVFFNNYVDISEIQKKRLKKMYKTSTGG